MERLALIAITLVGMGFCTLGIGKVAAANQWLSAPEFSAV